LILKRFEQSEAIERLERLGTIWARSRSPPDAQQQPSVGEIKLEEIVDRSIVRKLDDSGLIDRTLAAAGVR
jgi:hypothetical protein